MREAGLKKLLFDPNEELSKMSESGLREQLSHANESSPK